MIVTAIEAVNNVSVHTTVIRSNSADGVVVEHNSNNEYFAALRTYEVTAHLHTLHCYIECMRSVLRHTDSMQYSNA
jgi:hypothetical protein